MDKNLILLGLGHFLALAIVYADLTICDFVGVKFLPNGQSGLATISIGCFIASSGAILVPAGVILNKIGYKNLFLSGQLIGLLGALICVASFFMRGNWAFGAYCIGQIPQGFSYGILQYYRHVGSLVGGTSEGAKAWSIAVVISSGALGGIVGTELDSVSEYWIPGYQYLPAYFWIIFFYIIHFIILWFVEINIPSNQTNTEPDNPRPLHKIVFSPEYAYSLVTCTIVNVLKVSFSTITPLVLIGVHIPLFYVTFLTQFHAICMYLPSFFTSKIIGKFGAANVSLFGTIVTLIGAIIYMINDGDDWHKFWIVGSAMGVIGFGWNFAFIGGTTVLSSSYRLNEKFKAESFNDTLMFGLAAILSMVSGSLVVLEGLKNFLLGVIAWYVVVICMHIAYITWKCSKTPKSNSTVPLGGRH